VTIEFGSASSQHRVRVKSPHKQPSRSSLRPHTALSTHNIQHTHNESIRSPYNSRSHSRASCTHSRDCILRAYPLLPSLRLDMSSSSHLLRRLTAVGHQLRRSLQTSAHTPSPPSGAPLPTTRLHASLYSQSHSPPAATSESLGVAFTKVLGEARVATPAPVKIRRKPMPLTREQIITGVSIVNPALGQLQ
jgi:hypothetical protein